MVYTLLACVAAASSIAGTAPDPLPGHRLSSPPTIDGDIDLRAEWAGAPLGGEGVFDEKTGSPGSEGMRFWVAYDDAFIYVAAQLDDSRPEQIRATQYRTNAGLGGDDLFSFGIEPFGGTSEFNVFEINPRGATNLRIAGGRAAKREWLGDFSAAAKVTDKGWQVEAKIPWSLMRLPAAGSRDLRISAGRRIMRFQRFFTAYDVANGKSDRYPLWKNVHVPRPSGARSLKLLPFMYGGFDERDGAIVNSGLDLKTSLTDQVELVGSINPDFRNIENQVLSLDFSYFERLAGESRPFFLEGRDFFGTSWDAPLFVSQRIRSFDLGLKAFGKLGDDTRAAVLNAADFGERNSSVASVQHRFGPRTSATVGVTNLSDQRLSNFGSFLGASHGFGHLNVFGQVSRTTDSIVGNGHRMNTGLGYYLKGVSAAAELVEVSGDYLPRLGYAPETDYRGVKVNAGFERLTPGPVMEYGGSIFSFDYNRLDGQAYRRGIGFSTTTTFRDGADLDTSFVSEDYLGSKDHNFKISLEKPRGEPYRSWEIQAQSGRFSGEEFRLLGGGMNYRPIQDLQLNVSYQHVWFGESRSLLICSGSYDLKNDTSLSGRIVYRDGHSNAYLAFKRSGNRGVEYFVILGDPNSLTSRLGLVLKVAVPLDVRL